MTLTPEECAAEAGSPRRFRPAFAAGFVTFLSAALWLAVAALIVRLI